MVWLIALAGLMIGSFANVLIARYDQLETVIATRSHCPHCRKQIAWYDLVPLLSYIILQARCRYCKEKISWQYPFIELLAAALAAHLYLVYGLSWLSVAYFVIFTLLVVIAVIDLESYTVPDIFMLPAILLSFIVAALVAPTAADVTHRLWGVLLAGGGLAVLMVASRERWLGAGDIGFGVVMGLLGGWLGSVVGLIFAFVLGSLVGLGAIALRRKGFKDSLPFGPFLVLGIYLATLYGERLAMWYLTTIRFY